MIEINYKTQCQNVKLQAWMSKQSRFLKSWRERWFVLTENAVMTFKQRRVYNSPTEVIPLLSITTVKSTDQQIQIPHSFKIQTSQSVFYIKANSAQEKQQWIGQLGKALIKMNQKQKNEEFD